MHIYILLTAEGYQRSFPPIWGWHWYRSYLMPKERPEPQKVTWDWMSPSFCSDSGLMFSSCALQGFVLACIACTEVSFLLKSIKFPANHFYPSGKNYTLCACSYQMISKSIFALVWVSRIAGICARTANIEQSVLSAGFHLSRGSSGKAYMTFCQEMVNSAQTNPHKSLIRSD